MADDQNASSLPAEPDLGEQAPDLAQELRALRSVARSLGERVGGLNAADGLDGRQAAVVAAELTAITSMLSIARVRLLPVIDDDGLWATTGTRSFPVWVANEHRLGVNAARAQVRLARTLRDHLPVTAAAASAGEITLEQAQILATLAPTTDQRRELLADPHQECNEAFLVAHARELSVDETRVLARQWAAYADPDADDRGYVESCEREHLEIARLGEMYDVAGQLTVEHGQILKNALAAVTTPRSPGDHRSTGQRRASALVDVARLSLEHEKAATTGGKARPLLSVLVDYPTMVAVTDAAAARTTAPAPVQGTLVEEDGTTTDTSDGLAKPARCGTGPTRTPPMVTAALLSGRAIAGGPQFVDRTPVSRASLERIACDSALHRVVFGPESEVLDVGRTARTFTRSRRTAIIARDKHCRYPGCTAPPALCEGHHVEQWARDHGATSVDNGILLCGFHHDLVHRRAVAIRRRGRRWVFTDPHGHPIAPEDDAGTGPPVPDPGHHGERRGPPTASP